jgi:hypothetical protein
VISSADRPAEKDGDAAMKALAFCLTAGNEKAQIIHLVF